MNRAPRVSILCSSPDHPVYARLVSWGHYDELVTSARDLSGGDLLFLVSCTEIVPPETRDLYSHALVIHASDLPIGRGWSPHVWQIVNGARELTVSLLTVDDPVDTGAIWAKRRIPLLGTELYDEINEKLFSAELSLMDWAVQNFESVNPTAQVGEGSYYRRRSPEDSRIYPDRSLAEQFDLLRVCDPNRFPAFMDFRGRRFTIRVDAVDTDTPTT